MGIRKTRAMRYAESDMNIQSLHIKNFKNFEDKKLEFAEGFNLIVGDNGTGKTALLEALSVSLDGFLNLCGFIPRSLLRSFRTGFTLVHEQIHS